MGIDVRLETEGSRILDSVEDGSNCIARFLPQLADKSFACIRFIDPYGETVFNGMQIDDFLEEWKRARPLAKTPSQEEAWMAVGRMASRCKDDVHLYLKFIGD